MRYKRLYATFIDRFEKLLDYRLSYWTYSVLNILEIFLYFLILKKRKISLIGNKFYSIAYNYYYLRTELKLAYKYRIRLTILHEKWGKKAMRKNASNYLDIICGDHIPNFNFSANEIEYLKHRKIWNAKIFKKNVNKDRETPKSILICGPATELSKIKFKDFDYIVFNKPIELDNLNVESHKVILILNNQWSINKIEEVVGWAKKYYNAKIFSPNKIGLRNENNHGFQNIPIFPFRSSLMGLQRSIIILLTNFNIETLTLEGFNFSLSERPYQKWYPSLLKQHHGNFAKGFIHTNMIHDFLLNYLFVKKIVSSECYQVDGSVTKYTKMNTTKVLNIFCNKIQHYKKTG